jgi:cytochrome c biogenesis protein CcmG, thiol:disulfide interchange protein DsbE
MPRVSPLVFIPPVAFAALAGLFAFGMMRDDPNELPSALAGGPAPKTVVQPLGNITHFDDAVLRDGRVKLVNFFASWCAPCRVEHPNLMLLQAEGLPIYGINYKDDPANAVAFLAELGNPYAAAGADPDGQLAIDWGVYGVPETFVVDGEGKIIARLAGPATQRTIAERLRPALAEAGE